MIKDWLVPKLFKLEVLKRLAFENWAGSALGFPPSKYHQWVRSFSFPGSTSTCGVFSPGRMCAVNYPRASWGKKPPRTGVDPGELNERTQCKIDNIISNLLVLTSMFSKWRYVNIGLYTDIYTNIHEVRWVSDD